MRQIIRRRELIDDDVHYAGEHSAGGTRAVASLAEFLAATAAGQPTADSLLLEPADEVALIASQLSHLKLIVLNFPKVGEGRGFSQARLLRQRYRYAGELRARGALKRDQLVFLARCGFDSFELDPSENLPAALAAFNTFSVAYQDGSEALVHVKRRHSSAS
jgi:uncharacterized protein (DUF934 family)